MRFIYIKFRVCNLDYPEEEESNCQVLLSHKCTDGAPRCALHVRIFITFCIPPYGRYLLDKLREVNLKDTANAQVGPWWHGKSGVA